jgi:hypothetical protein
MTAEVAAEISTDRAWLFGRRTDLAVFGGPALAAALLVIVGRALGIANGETPPVLWLAAVLGVDVAHVWSTVYRTYADPVERARRWRLYLFAPVAVYAAGVALHAGGGGALFWRVLAYAAVFHFVRQQYGWMALYRRRAGESAGRLLDSATIYLATLGPLIWWHATPSRHFHWFLPGDFALGLPPRLGDVALALEAAALVAYAGRAILQGLQGQAIPWGKHLLVFSTAACWYGGIVAFDSDYVFTVTNVLIHGVPYVALIWRDGAVRHRGRRGLVPFLFEAGWPAIYAALVAIALVEEGLWDGLVWHDHPQFFGSWGWALGPGALAWLVPLLALPQGVHYLLDGFIWKREAGRAPLGA